MLATLRIFLTKQRGAMFGMDARVALTIFGALAAIGGYTMLGRIDTARTGRFIQEINAISNGLAALQADVGQLVPVDLTSSDDVFEVLRLDPGIPRWSGPYINDEVSNMVIPGGGAWSSQARQDDLASFCDYTENCYVWLSLSNFPETTFDEVNDIIDENGGSDAEAAPMTEGRVRFSGTGTGTFSFRAIGWDSMRGRTVK